MNIKKLNKIELMILNSIRENLNDDEQMILDDQLSRFTKVQRNAFGQDTRFYWLKWFNKVVHQINYPKRFSVNEREIKFFEIVFTLDEILVKASVYLIDGVIFSFEYDKSIKYYQRKKDKFNISIVETCPKNADKWNHERRKK